MADLVFLPGAGGSATFWRPVADRLTDLGAVHVFGWPGFGDVPGDASLSSLDDLYRWLVKRLPERQSHVVAQSMGGVLAVRLALEHPHRVANLVLVATSGGVDVARLGGVDWRPEYLASMARVPKWFVKDRTDFTERVGEIRAPTLLVWSDSDPISPLSVRRFLSERIANARIATVRGGTHAFAEEQPDEVAALIRSFLT
jgi:pimeloyl-ACP methyl ester carboxylesterase